MSRSSLWVLDKDFMGEELCEFANSWLFSPIAWDILLDKYMPHRKMVLFNGKKCGYMPSVMSDKNLNADLNDTINNCKVLSDRILWEMGNQQIFFTKDKIIVANSIREFLVSNAKYDRTDEGTLPLEQEHIIGRFNEVADSIENLNEEENPYFIFKNTSVDDNVEYWFTDYNEKTEESEPRSLNEIQEFVAEFVEIIGINIKFISNTDYFKEKNNG